MSLLPILIINYNPATSDAQKLTNPCGKSQPWKKDWPPTGNNNNVKEPAVMYRTDAQGSALVDGNLCVGGVDDSPATSNSIRLTDLLSKKANGDETKSPPWKAHLSPVDQAKASAVTYLTDAKGCALVDGF